MNNVSSLSALLLLTAFLFAITLTPIAAAPTTNQPTCQALLYLPMVAGGHETRQAQHAKSSGPSALGVDQPDFNGDGCAELVIAVPGEEVETVTKAGMVQVVYGGTYGLSAVGNQVWHRNGGYDENGTKLGDLQDAPEEEE